ncbi:MAG: cytochrome c family protein [Acidobacteriia bacterium]|nr:cytochrome c family protein [Terriglobia bacterium]
MKLKQILLGLAMVGSLPLFAQAQYIGSGRCRPCHLQEAKSWQQTKMASGFDLLKAGVAAEVKKSKKLDPNKDYTHDAECLVCHTTGYGKPGGFESIEKTPALAGVQCEACHGAGGNYAKPNVMSFQNKEFKRAEVVAAGLVLPDAKACQGCHNSKSEFYKPFDFESRQAKGVHQRFPLKYQH